MFTGLIRALGMVQDVSTFGKGRRFRIDLASLAGSLAVGQSLAVNGVCLTATGVSGAAAAFDVVAETVSRSNLGLLRRGDRVNLEPAVKAGEALDGHLVLGHVDAVAEIIEVDAGAADARVVRIALPPAIRHLVAEKGSVAVDGISLTVAQAERDWFSVSIIPHSWDNSTLGQRAAGDRVNLEADVLARYAARIMRYGAAEGGGLSETFLKENGFA